MALELSIGMASNPRTWPVLDGRVKPDGIALTCNIVPVSELFWRQLRFAEFDVSEMSFSSLLMTLARGDERWVGLPIFTTREFFHTRVLVRRDAGIERPEDLKGKRVGVPEYQQTAALWSRGALQHEWGVKPSDVEWFMERSPSHSHAGAVKFTPPAGTTINQIPDEKNIGEMMLKKELDAALLYYGVPNRVDRSSARLDGHPEITGLFPDRLGEGVRYYRKTGIFPINHGMVVRRTIAEKNPWVITNLLAAFRKANEIAERERAIHTDYHIVTGLLPREAREALATPLIRHGIAANRKTLETAAQYSVEQGLTPRQMKLDEVFAPATLDE